MTAKAPLPLHGARWEGKKEEEGKNKEASTEKKNSREKEMKFDSQKQGTGHQSSVP